jgi:CheY-like chemotaxis protein
MGGELEIESEEEKGSTFYFTLTLEKVEEAEPRKIINMVGFTVGLLGSENRMAASIRRNLESYVTYAGATFDLYDEKEVFKPDSKPLPDILFIDHTFHQRSGELDVYLNMECKIVLMTTADRKKNIEEMAERIDRVIYKPLNQTKTMKALEVAYEEKVQTSSKAQAADRKILFENLHVLVAEDNSINRKLIKNVLNGFGIEVTLASNGEEAVHMRMQNDYDMIFMDIQMPVLGGIEATHQIIEYEEKNRKHHIPIVALTANALSGDREKYMDEGMDNYLSKPIDLERLNILLQEYFPVSVRAEEAESEAEEAEAVQPEPVSEERDAETEERAKISIEPIVEERLTEKREEEEQVSPVTPESETVREEKAEIEPEAEEEISVPVETAEEEVPEVPVVHHDILLYHSLSLIASLYEKMLGNLGYTIETVEDEQQFMDKLESSEVPYRFVIFQGKPFENVKCLISDLVRGTGATPFVLLPRGESAKNYCCTSLEEGSDIEVVKEKLTNG